MGMEIHLNQCWQLGVQIGKGGFGRVFEAVGEDGRQAAVKLIPKEPGADRELLFEDLKGVRCVVPIIDSGDWESHWVIVMPRADKSLREHLQENGTLSVAETVTVLTDIATALSDIKGRVVHRDLKPENVLLLNGHWCISDFGIARYAEASTAVDTHKWSWTAPYNPPERWRFERAIPASDIYSLGVMAFEMVTGGRPFNGPDFREQHLTQEPPLMTGHPPLLAALVAECLMKAPEVRPSADSLLTRLDRVLRPASSGASLLQAASLAQSQQIAGEASAMSAAQNEAQRKQQVVASASKVLSMLIEQLEQSVRDNAPAVVIQPTTNRFSSWSAKLGQATLSIKPVEEARTDVWGHWSPKIQVIAHTMIEIRIPPDRYEYEGRGHSLWFCDAQEEGVFGWYETAFMFNPLVGKRGRQNPFALPPGVEAGKAISNVMAEFQVAWPFTRINIGQEHDFLDRWMTWFAQAAQGQLVYPRSMPERPPQGSWRQ